MKVRACAGGWSRTGIGALVAAAVALTGAPALAQQRDVSVQAKLELPGGGTPADGSAQLRASVFATELGGSPIEQVTVTATVEGGIVSSLLPLSRATFDGGDRWIGFTLDGVDLLPRIKMTSAPMAIRADVATSADAVGGLAATGGNATTLQGVLDVLDGLGQRVARLSDAAEVLVYNGANVVAALKRATGSGRLELMRTDGTVSITLDGSNGRATVSTIQINGGSDLAEPFVVSSPCEATDVRPGMVAVIDTARDGALKLCDSANDAAVAGVISGANGLAPGLTLSAEGHELAQGDWPIAMAGRVWVWCDASAEGGSGPIGRGDRLTTSATVGHAMAVRGAAPAGAVLGKAMTELRSGRGLVLMLVQPQ